MSRRSTRLLTSGYYFEDEAQQVSYRESPVKVFRRRKTQSGSAIPSLSSSFSMVSSVGSGLLDQSFTSSGYSSSEEHDQSWRVRSRLPRRSQRTNVSQQTGNPILKKISMFFCGAGHVDKRFMLGCYLLCFSLVLTLLASGVLFLGPSTPVKMAESGPGSDMDSVTAAMVMTDHLRDFRHEVLQHIDQRHATVTDNCARQMDDFKREVSLLKEDGDRHRHMAEILQMEVANLKDMAKDTKDRDWQAQTTREIDSMSTKVAELSSSISDLNHDQHNINTRIADQDKSKAQMKKELTDFLISWMQDRQGLGHMTAKDVHDIVQSALNLNKADGTGMADFALESLGAYVIKDRCSDTYRTRAGVVSLYGIPLWYTSDSPSTVLQPEVHPGKCWAFKGSQGFVTIALSHPVRVTHVSLEHIPKSITPTGRIDSAPRDFVVYGFTGFDEHEEGTILGKFTYDSDGKPIQTFKLPDEVNEVYNVVQLKVLNNWGNSDYSCIYRFRVHGQAQLN
ncbi:SUN domain-containing protein 3-like [Engraulis encrasicolus]|uniref:SUN domain-containing protein 3-like n=1 Tax=Engraulis encrasicolus TaxID=184585 RepID=UPI002FD483FB